MKKQILSRIILSLCIVSLALASLMGCSPNTTSPVVASEAPATQEVTDKIRDDERTEDVTVDEGETEIARPAGWSEDTHSKEADPDYDVVFPQDEVNRIDITIAAEDWQAMLDDMTGLYGEFGVRGDAPVPGEGVAPGERPMQPPQRQGDPQGQPPMQQPGNPPGGFGGFADENPIWVPATVEFEGDTWYDVGIRFKGNSSLRTTWQLGSYKLPLRLDFDEFEDDVPEIDDQRFYGFKQLALASNFHDDSLLREKVTADIFREAGVPAAHTAFYRVYVDYGEGPIYFGLYTMTEVVEDTVIKEQFSDDDGNLYKPEGGTFAAGSFSEEGFDKETNEDEGDWSDVLALFEVLHAGTRITDPATWRADLEAIFDVDGFLRWLAVNTVIQNWDTYGAIGHNYYLYHDPETDLLTWIPWDNNEALKSYAGAGRRSTLSLSMDEVNERWPLIRYLLDDETYYARYVAYVEETVTGAFEPSRMIEIYRAAHELIAPYVTGAEGEIEGYTLLTPPQAFESGLQELIEHVQGRYDAATSFVAAQQE